MIMPRVTFLDPALSSFYRLLICLVPRLGSTVQRIRHVVLHLAGWGRPASAPKSRPLHERFEQVPCNRARQASQDKQDRSGSSGPSGSSSSLPNRLRDNSCPDPPHV